MTCESLWHSTKGGEHGMRSTLNAHRLVTDKDASCNLFHHDLSWMETGTKQLRGFSSQFDQLINASCILFRRAQSACAPAKRKLPPKTTNPGITRGLPSGFYQSQIVYSFAANAAKSAMRFEKPHSLSYQLTTFTTRFWTTAVNSESTIELCGS